MARGTIVLAGALAQRPRRGGHTCVFLQYLLGFRRLGWDVLLLDRLKSDLCVDEAGRPCSLHDSLNLRYFLDVVRRFDLAGSFALICGKGEEFIGLSRQQVIERTRTSAFLLNVMGFLTDPEILAAAPRRVFLDIDPGFGQMWQHLGLSDLFSGHDDHVTIGQNIGKAGCTIPTCGLDWITTAPLVVRDWWTPATRAESAGGCFTSVCTWRGEYGPVEHAGKTYGLRVHEFRKFAALPRLSGQPFQVALDIHPADDKDRSLLTDNGWRLVDPLVAASDPSAYQEFVRASRAEFMVAKNMYVQTHSGWLSDRSICYLASGKPVLVQDTGLAELYPVGEGLVTFNTLAEAVAGVEAICSRYERHAQAALALSEAYFCSDRVLSKLLTALAVG